MPRVKHDDSDRRNTSPAAEAGLLSCKVYTPTPLAQAMVAAISDGHHQRWLEPSVGKGVFLRAIRGLSGPRREIVAVDLDSDCNDNDSLALVYRGVDFLRWSATIDERVDCVVGNPPFVSIRQLPASLRHCAAAVRDQAGARIGGSANTWYAFLLRSIMLLRPGGHLAFVLPASCEYANYCQPGRHAIASKFDRIDLIRSRRPLFEGVQEGTVVLVCRNYGGSTAAFRRHEVDGLDTAVDRLGQLGSYRARPCPRRSASRPESHSETEVRLGSVLHVGIGGVSGDARYFTFGESRRKALGIPIGAVRPVVTKARQIRRAWVGEDAFRLLRDSNERIWLFRPPEGFLDYEAVRDYLKLSVANGGCERHRYKIKSRDPWYKTSLPRRPDAFVSGMSSLGVWLCVNEFARLNATNTLYVVRFRSQEERARRYEWALALLTSQVRQQIRRTCRIYADGMRKVEPGQLAEILVPVPPGLDDAKRIYRDALDCLLGGDGRSCEELADEMILGVHGNTATEE